MSFFYNDEYLKLNADSINCESFKNAIGNPKLKNFYTFTWTDVQNPVKETHCSSDYFFFCIGHINSILYRIADFSCYGILYMDRCSESRKA